MSSPSLSFHGTYGTGVVVAADTFSRTNMLTGPLLAGYDFIYNSKNAYERSQNATIGVLSVLPATQAKGVGANQLPFKAPSVAPVPTTTAETPKTPVLPEALQASVYRAEIKTAQGTVLFEAKPSASGTTAILRDISIFPKDYFATGQALKAAPEIAQFRVSLLQQLSNAGFTKVQITAIRISGANAGRTIDSTFNLPPPAPSPSSPTGTLPVTGLEGLDE